MSDLTRILEAIDTDDARAAGELLPLVYGELRRLARQRMSKESPDHTLNPTALVHEAYIRLVGKDDPRWQNRGHFFAAAAEAMRRILIDHARAKQTEKRGGDRARIALDAAVPLSNTSPDEMLLLDETMRNLSHRYPLAGKLVELRFFGGLSMEEAAAVAGVSAATANRHWAFARAWIHVEIGRSQEEPKSQQNTAP